MLSAFKRLFGAISSGNPAARVGILIRLIAPFTRIIDRIFPIKKVETEGIPPVVIITSPPRSGSTVTFQTLTRLLPVRYISNWHALFPRHASGYLLKNKAFGKGLKGFKNYYGYTASFNDVNEANEFFDAIFAGQPTTEEIRIRFKKFIDQVSPDGGPVLMKNVRNFPNMAALHAAVPEVFFLRVKRDFEQNIQSVLRAYFELGGFHPVPDAIKHKDKNKPHEFSVLQILELNAEIDRQEALVSDDKWMSITYEQFCNDTISIVKSIASKLDLQESDIRMSKFNEPLKASFSRKVSEEDAKKVRDLLEQHMPKYQKK